MPSVPDLLRRRSSAASRDRVSQVCELPSSTRLRAPMQVRACFILAFACERDVPCHVGRGSILKFTNSLELEMCSTEVSIYIISCMEEFKHNFSRSLNGLFHKAG